MVDFFPPPRVLWVEEVTLSHISNMISCGVAEFGSPSSGAAVLLNSLLMCLHLDVSDGM